MADFNPIEPFKPGPSISAGHLNQVVDGIKNVSGQAPIVVTEQGNTVYISLDGEGDFFFVGEIDSGDQPSDYSDAKYFVKRQKLLSSDIVLAWEDETYPDSDAITVTNLWETQLPNNANHLLSDGVEMVVFRITDNSVPPEARYVTMVPPTQLLFPVKVSVWGDPAGKEGNASDQCSYTYLVTDRMSDLVYGSDMAPVKNRPQTGQIGAPSDSSWGLAFFDSDMAVALWDANEYLVTSDCP